MTSNEGTRRSVLTPTPFATQLSSYLAHLVTEAGGDMSGRWLSARIDRSRDYCRKILNVVQAMTTNDIALVADLFDVSPYQFVRDARDWGEPDNVTPLRPLPSGPRNGIGVPPEVIERSAASPKGKDNGEDGEFDD